MHDIKHRLLEYVKLLVKQYEALEQENDELREKIGEMTGNKPESKAFLSKRIEDFDLSVRAFNACKKIGVTTLMELVYYTEDELMKHRSVGLVTMQELNNIVTQNGLTFGMFRI